MYLDEELKVVLVFILIIWGEDEVFFFVVYGEWVVVLILNSWLVILLGVGYLFWMEKLLEFVEVVKLFLD